MKMTVKKMTTRTTKAKAKTTIKKPRIVATAKRKTPIKKRVPIASRRKNPIIKYYRLAIWMKKTPNKKQFLGLAGDVVDTESQSILSSKNALLNFFKINEKKIAAQAHRVELIEIEFLKKK